MQNNSRSPFMSDIRNTLNPLITSLLKIHDQIESENVHMRNKIKRQILFLMTTVKMTEKMIEIKS